MKDWFVVFRPEGDVAEMFQPVAGVEEKVVGREFIACGHMAVCEYKMLNVSCLQQFAGELHLELFFAMEFQHAFFVGITARFGEEPGDSERLSRMQQTVEPPVEAIVEYPLDKQVFALFSTQSVAVTHKTAVSVDSHQLCLAVDSSSECPRKVVLHPHVVVSRKVVNLNTLCVQLLQIGEQGDVTFRHHVAVFEPVVEDVAQEEEVLEIPFHALKQLHEFLFPFLAGGIRRGAEMRVRHEQTVAVQHDRVGNVGHFFHGAKIQNL